MSRKLPTGTTKEFLENVTIPNHGGRYTVITHKAIMDNANSEIVSHGFLPETELYRANTNGNVANGIVMLNYSTDADLKMMLVWGNSYDKSTRFKCGIGAYVQSTGNYMFAGDLSNYSRKHTGNANQEALLKMRYQLAQAKFFYEMLVSAKQKMENVELSNRQMAEILGALYADLEVLTIEQVSYIKGYMYNTTLIANSSPNNLWNYYNILCMALRNSHPKSWFEAQTGAHQFIMNEVLFATPQALPSIEAVEPVVEDYPGQLNLLDAIADAEAREQGILGNSEDDTTESVMENSTIEEASDVEEESPFKEVEEVEELVKDEESFFSFEEKLESEDLDFPEL